MIDYENVSPETLKEWEKEYRNKCLREMRQYLKLFPDVTPEEKNDLSKWVRSGHSPYENSDYIATESGRPMDFIIARRFLVEMCQEHSKNPESYCGSPDPMELVSGDSDSMSDTPF